MPELVALVSEAAVWLGEVAAGVEVGEETIEVVRLVEETEDSVLDVLVELKLLDDAVGLELLLLVLERLVVVGEVEDEEEEVEEPPPPSIDVASVYIDCASDSKLLRFRVWDAAKNGRDSSSHDSESRMMAKSSFLTVVHQQMGLMIIVQSTDAANYTYSADHKEYVSVGAKVVKLCIVCCHPQNYNLDLCVTSIPRAYSTPEGQVLGRPWYLEQHELGVWHSYTMISGQ